MPPLRANPNGKSHGRQCLMDRVTTQATKSRGIKGEKPVLPVRQSVRLPEGTEFQERSLQLPSPTSLIPEIEYLQGSVDLSNLHRKRKRSEEPGEEYTPDIKGAVGISSQSREIPARDPPRTSPTYCTVALRNITKDGDANPIQRWIETGSWSGEEFDQGSSMTHLLSQKRSTASSSKKESSSNNESGITGVSGGEKKNPGARSRRYEQLLLSAGIHMNASGQVATTEECKALCQALLDTKQTVPCDSLFNDSIFMIICERASNRNEARIVRDLTPLLVPSAEILYFRGATNLQHLIETIDEGWFKSIPLVNGPRPQPDFTVGVRASAFTSNQLKKMQPAVGSWEATSRIVAMDEMYFPFLTAEVKCGNEGLNIADRQNAHSAAVAANAMVELYRLVSRQNELDRKILTFSISHDHESVRIYGHYALIGEKSTLFYRHVIDKFNFTSRNGKEKWTSYTFTRNVYDKFYPTHLQRICSAVDLLPYPEDFEVEAFSQPPNVEGKA